MIIFLLEKHLIYKSFINIKIVYFRQKFNVNFKYYLACHSLCKTCNGPLINNCLSCFEENNRYYVSGLNICLC